MKAKAIIEMAPDGGYWSRLEESFPDFAIFGAGNTADEARESLEQAYAEAREDLASEGKEAPELEFDYRYDMKSFFDHFDFLNVSKVAARAGINPSLMRRYTSGAAKAGPGQYERLSRAVKGIAEEMARARL